MPCILLAPVVLFLALHYLPLAPVDLYLHLGTATGMCWGLTTLWCLVLPSSCRGLVQSPLSLYLTLDTGEEPCQGCLGHQTSLLMPIHLEGRPGGRGERERLLETNHCQSAGKFVLPPPHQKIEVASASELHLSFVTVGRKSCFTGTTVEYNDFVSNQSCIYIILLHQMLNYILQSCNQ